MNTEIATTTSIWGLRIKDDGTIDTVQLIPDQEGVVLRGLYAAIGCELVECVRLTDQLDMWVDEEGYGEFNRVATAVSHRFQLQLGAAKEWLQPYFGTAVLLGVNQATSQSLDLSSVPGLTSDQLVDLQKAADSL